MTDRDSPQARDLPSAPGEERVATPVPALATWPDDRRPSGDAEARHDGASGGVPDWSPLSAVAALVGAVALGGIGGALVAIVVGALLGVNVTSGTLPPGLEITATAVQDAAFVGVAVLIATLGGRRLRPAQFGLRTTGFWQAVGWIIVLNVSFFAVTAAWTAALNDHTKEKVLDTLGAGQSGVLLVASAILTCVLAPFCEEFLFRGYIFTALRNWRGAVARGAHHGNAVRRRARRLGAGRRPAAARVLRVRAVPAVLAHRLAAARDRGAQPQQLDRVRRHPGLVGR